MKFLIFAGGSGTRLWPVSRKDNPKQFQTFFSNKSLFQLTIERLSRRFSFEDFFIVTPPEYVSIIKSQVPEIIKENILIESETRDTLACVGFAAFIIDSLFKDEEIAILWSDHLIKYEKVFLDAFSLASKYSKEKNKIVQIDVNPTNINVNLGYIQIGDQIESIDGFSIYEFIKQTEKPDYKTARKFIESFDYLWHTGYSVYPPSKLVDLYRRYVPKIAEKMDNIVKLYSLGEDFSQLYSSIDKISIDYAILEKVDNSDIVVIPADLGWSDVGNWESLKQVLEDSIDENVSHGENILIDTKNSLVFSNNDKKIITTIGIEDLVIVDTPDALLVCSLSDSYRVKDLISEIKKNKKDQLL